LLVGADLIAVGRAGQFGDRLGCGEFRFVVREALVLVREDRILDITLDGEDHRTRIHEHAHQ